MTVDGTAGALACPLCAGAVPLGSTGCRPCSLPMRDVLRHAPRRGEGRRRAGRAIRVRLTAIVFYAGIVAWSWWQLPQILPFVILGAGIGGGLHLWKGRPWLGLCVFVGVVLVVPRFLWSAFGMGVLSDLADSVNGMF